MLIGTNVRTNNPQKNYFYSAKIVPQEVLRELPLWWYANCFSKPLKCGTGTASPARAHIYIYMCSISGRLFFANRFKNARFFSCTCNEWKWQKLLLPPVKATQLWAPKQRHLHLGLSFNAFNYGALMLRNISTPLLNGHARAIFERFNSPSFHTLFLRTSKSLKPLFLQRFVTISWVFLAPQLKTLHFFAPSMPDFEAKTIRKNPRLGGSTCFRPNTPIMKNGKKYVDPSRLALPTSPPHKVQHKMTAPKPRRTNKQPRD